MACHAICIAQVHDEHSTSTKACAWYTFRTSACRLVDGVPKPSRVSDSALNSRTGSYLCHTGILGLLPMPQVSRSQPASHHIHKDHTTLLVIHSSPQSQPRTIVVDQQLTTSRQDSISKCPAPSIVVRELPEVTCRGEGPGQGTVKEGLKDWFPYVRKLRSDKEP